MFCLLTGPPTPYIYNVTVVQRNNVSALDVAWDTVMYLSEVLYDNTLFQAISNKNLTCETDSGSCNLSPVECGEVHVIEVTASNEAGPSYPSSPVNFTTFPCPPQPLAVKELEDGNCMLTWDTVPYADSYEAIIEKDDGSEETCNTTSNNCTFPCQCGYTFLISVFAFNHAGSSPQGPILNYTTLPCCPGDVSISAVSTDTLEIIWTASRGAELYQTQAVDTSEVILCNDTATVCALSDLTCDNTYRVVVIPCNEITGCNRLCTSQHTADTAPCMPENLIVNLSNSSYIGVSWAATNRAATYTVTAVGDDGKHNCTTPGNSCVLTDLHCGSKYEISAIASSAAGQSLPSYSDFVETEPCCPENLTVHQATQAMTDVSWSNAIGAHSFITSLRSPRGHASCHTQDSHCLMGCITCGTNYTVTMQAFSHTGLSSSCTYQGFSSSPCCPSGVGLYRMTGNSVRVYWRSTGRYSFVADVVGTSNSYTCSASQGTYSCDIDNIQCGDVYHVVVAPLTPEGSKVTFCSQRLYSVTCSGTSVGMVTYRGKRSVG
uniref:Fibronectin type-III domain-containing protein n=1 Tax=Monopterus albus TaxID=43700 RepID=A0A3Q3K3U0_MONAL